MSEEVSISDFSPHLFWDVDIESLDWNKNKALIVQRVMEYGLINDWEIILNRYGIDQIGRICKNLRSLDPKSLVFIATLTETPLNSFRCYTTKPLTSTHWSSSGN
ncbi:MAG: hypothetical protein IT214_11145 [Chitinophagaceae bacterium]|jgi:hypothetical protein|nr:hypothetical protein [Chitinophagaceae bacterium]